MDFRFIILLLFFFSFSINARVTTASPTEDVKQEKPTVHTPRIAIKQLLLSLSENNYEALASNFDQRAKTRLEKANMASAIARFPKLLDMYGSLIPSGLVSNEAEGIEEPSLSTNFEKIGDIRLDNQHIPILLERVIIADGTKRWLISQRTIAQLFKVSSTITEPRINRLLPQFLLSTQWRGAPVGQWVAVLVVILFCSLIGRAFTLFSRLMAKRYERENEISRKAQVFSALAIPVGIVITVFTLLAVNRYLEFSILIRQGMSVLTLSALWVAVFMFIWSLTNNLSVHAENVLRQKNHLAGLSIVMFFRTSAKAVLFVTAVIIVLSSNGVDVTTGLAALGIGGIALALGAQKAIENLVGSIIIVADQPIRVGDFCKVGDMLGTVEHIGLRSTRIRTREDTVVSFPNGMLSSERIENFSLRRKFLFHTMLNLRYETKMEDLDNLLEALREHLKNNKQIIRENMRVRFVAYGAASLDVEVFCYIKANNYEVFLERKEKVLLSIAAFVEGHNSGFAFPSQTLYLAKDSLAEQDLTEL